MGGGGDESTSFYAYVLNSFSCTADMKITDIFCGQTTVHNGHYFTGCVIFRDTSKLSLAALKSIWGSKKSWPSPNNRYRKCVGGCRPTTYKSQHTIPIFFFSSARFYINAVDCITNYIPTSQVNSLSIVSCLFVYKKKTIKMSVGPPFRANK